MTKFYTILSLSLFLSITITMPSYSSGVLCTSDRSLCTVGEFTLHGENIFVEDGIMCTSDRSICTNGHSVLRTSGAVDTPKKTAEKVVKPKIQPVKKETQIIRW